MRRGDTKTPNQQAHDRFRKWSSPTWNTHRDELPNSNEDISYFRPTTLVFEAWDAPRERAEALDADAVVFQTPPSFDRSPDHQAYLDTLFTQIDRGGSTLAWGPQGDWRENTGAVGRLCERHDLVHAVDIFRDHPQGGIDVGYIQKLS